MKKKIFAGILALSIFLVPTAKADEVDPLVKDYIPRIESGEILPPQYSNNEISGENPTKEEWIKSVESQAVGGGRGMHKLLFM